MVLRKISTFTTVVTGGTPSTRKIEYWENGDIPWLPSGVCHDCIVESAPSFITRLGLDNSAAKMMPPDTVLIALTGATAGKVGYLTFDACANQSVTGILPSKCHVPKYVFYFLQFRRKKTLADCYGGAQPHISQGYVKDIEIPLPPLPTQQRIADELDELCALKKNAEDRLAILDQIVKSRFVEMFGRDPCLNEKRFPLFKMDDVVLFQGGSQPDKRYFEYEPTKDNVRLIQIRDYRTDRYKTYIPKTMAKRHCTKDDIMIGRYGPPIFQIFKGLDGAFNVAMMKATPKMGEREFVRAFLKQDCLLRYLESFSKRTAGQDGIQMDKLKAYPFPLPPLPLQREFAAFVAEVDKSKLTLRETVATLEQLYRAKLQEYFG